MVALYNNSNLGMSVNNHTSPSRASTHAQNFSTSTLQQKKDRAMATTSIGRAIQSNKQDGATTSIGRVGEEDQKVGSILHNNPTKRSVYDDDRVDEVRDRLRYQHIREMMREKKAAAALAAKAAHTNDKFGISLGTGVSFSRKIRGGFDKKMGKLMRKNKASYKNVSKKDKAILGNIIQKHAAARSTGSGYNYGDRKRMKMEIEQARQKGLISHEDSKDFKRIINNLE